MQEAGFDKTTTERETELVQKSKHKKPQNSRMRCLVQQNVKLYIHYSPTF